MILVLKSLSDLSCPGKRILFTSFMAKQSLYFFFF
uniref:Uncharacterized protein n=1 Tax=Rhizophora mucronata TaxID=61149 RepID=A0A2P2PC65_RHIMU